MRTMLSGCVRLWEQCWDAASPWDWSLLVVCRSRMSVIRGHSRLQRMFGQQPGKQVSIEWPGRY